MNYYSKKNFLFDTCPSAIEALQNGHVSVRRVAEALKILEVPIEGRASFKTRQCFYHCYVKNRKARKPIPQKNLDIFAAYQRGESAGVLAREYGVSKQRIHQVVLVVGGIRGEPLRKRCKTTHRMYKGEVRGIRIPLYVIPASITEAWWRNEQIYNEFMAGALMVDLAEEYNVSVGQIGQWVLKHRLRVGAPAKQPWLKPQSKFNQRVS